MSQRGSVESRSEICGLLSLSSVGCGLLSFLGRALSSPSSDLIYSGGSFLAFFSFSMMLVFVVVFLLAQEINRSVRSEYKSSWLDVGSNVISSDYHLVARICVLGGRFQEVLFGLWSTSPALLERKSRRFLQDFMDLLFPKVRFTLFLTPRRGVYGAVLVAAYAYKEVCPIGWVLQLLPFSLSLLTLGFQEVFVVYE